MEKQFFGKTKDGKDTYLYTFENEHLIMKVLNYGGTLQSFINKDTGIDVAQGFEDIAGYEGQPAHIGAMIGRCANRIDGAAFTLNGTTYHVTDNKNGMCLHGGNIGFDRRVYDVETTDNSLILTDVLPDGEEGWPGTMKLTITYTLLEDGIEIQATATSDKDTLFGITNHSYFNLGNPASILDDECKINATTIAKNDARGCALDEIKEVTGTPFDFTSFKKLGKDIHMDCEQLKFANGYDHHFQVPGTGLREMATVRSDKVELTLKSDLPGMHLYTSNGLNGLTGKNGVSYVPHSSVCLEPEFYPNGINYADVEPKPILKAGETVTQTIQYLLKKI